MVGLPDPTYFTRRSLCLGSALLGVPLSASSSARPSPWRLGDDLPRHRLARLFGFAAGLMGSLTGVSGGNSVSGYEVNAVTGALAGLASSPYLTGGAVPMAMAVDYSGRIAYATNNTTNNVSAFSIDPNTGALALTTASPFLTGTGPRGIAVTAAPE